MSVKQVLVLLILAFFAVKCGTINEKNKGKGFNIFTIQQDLQLGAQVAKEIDQNQKEYPYLDSTKYKEVYNFVYKIRNIILNSGSVDFKKEFPWRIRIIKNDKILNAFCTPGGYIYVYTGILKYMESEDELAGVLAHEIGHADMRHSTRQMTKLVGIQVLLDIIAGNHTYLKQVTTAIIGLKFSRQHETEADERSVRYLCPTSYNAAGGALFFEKIKKENSAQIPAFLSTHPNPENRIEHFYNSKTTLGCSGNENYKSDYQKMKSRLPN